MTHPTYEHLDRLVDVDPIGLRDAAWAAIRELSTEVAALTAERDRLRGEIEQIAEQRDLAIAHDRQPYPTAWAYEQSQRALEAHRARANQAEAERDAVQALLVEEQRDHAATRKSLADEEALRHEAEAALEAIRSRLSEANVRSMNVEGGHLNLEVEPSREWMLLEALKIAARSLLAEAKEYDAKWNRRPMPGSDNWDKGYVAGMQRAAHDVANSIDRPADLAEKTSEEAGWKPGTRCWSCLSEDTYLNDDGAPACRACGRSDEDE